MKAWLVVLVALTVVPACRIRTRRMPMITGSGSLQVTVDAYQRLSTGSGAITVASTGPEDVPDLMRVINRDALPRDVPVDLVYVVDTTGSMGDDIGAAKAQMRAILRDLTKWNPDRRVGIVAYRDRGDPYVSRVVLPLEVDEQRIVAGIDSLRVDGGGDLREHVYAALHTAIHEQPWRPGASHHIVLIGDAPPHEDYADDPRTFNSVMLDAARPELAVKIHTITAYCDKACRDALAAEERP